MQRDINFVSHTRGQHVAHIFIHYSGVSCARMVAQSKGQHHRRGCRRADQGGGGGLNKDENKRMVRRMCACARARAHHESWCLRPRRTAGGQLLVLSLLLLLRLRGGRGDFPSLSLGRTPPRRGGLAWFWLLPRAVPGRFVRGGNGRSDMRGSWRWEWGSV